ncbi:GNAT family N-acetyltransferase, partial [Streptomyces sp. 4F14]|uniref:GNAT family N-acetyltransferase n=1 Tax=Streptomyces sp. 4F14 TaxID=3394380 RepID=UPI003A8881F9
AVGDGAGSALRDAVGDGAGSALRDAVGDGAGSALRDASAGGVEDPARDAVNRPVAIGRCVVDGRWAGFSAVEVDPGARRRGLATDVMAVLAGRALAEGASAAWLQVEADNAGALALYEGLGFTVHHSYHHYREPA